MNKSIKISAIPKDKNYIGYLWMSDSQTPKEFQDPRDLSQELNISDTSNPFIIEGQLYCKDKEQNKSYSIKYVDGEHIVVEYDLNQILANWESKEGDLKKFIPNRLSASKILFRQYWKPEEDKLCEGMDVLVPAAFVFVGFEK